MENLIKELHCGLCSLQFDNRIGFDMHQSIIHGLVTKIKEKSVVFEKKSIQCSICETTFVTRRNLNRHTVSIHEGKKPYNCKMCDISFAEQGTLKKHMYFISS